jgi:acetyl coenzyme A synthetase (ADP forming)-like protein
MTIARGVYPRALEAEVATRDGSIVHVRPIRPDDTERLLTFFRELPDDDRRLRFFSLGNDLKRTARDETNIDYVSSLGLIATAGPDQRVVGHVLYAPYGDDRAEVAFTIARDYQSRGLGTLLLGQLAQAAAANGIETFQALVMPENQRMLQLLRQSGFPIKTRYDWDTIEVTFPTALTPEALERFERREEIASANALRRVLYPRSVAVIGASRRPDGVGAAIVRNLLAFGFKGPVYPVNPATTEIQSLRCYPTVSDIDAAVDLAIIAIPSSGVVEVARQCGQKGVAAIVATTAGFSEVGAAGAQRQAELLHVCREYGMRLIGPNCIGVINTDPAAPMNATFGPLTPRTGRLGLATQSGALGLAAIDFSATRDLGFSSIVSMGNKADISGNDLLGFWASDPRTDVVLLYLESFGNPRRFARVARSLGRTKPIVALKSGRSAVGARATASHTGALLAASDVTVDALFHQAGVVRTDTLDEMLDVADLLVHQPLPAGRRVAVITNAGGPAVMCADACEAYGLQVAPLTESTRAQLSELLPPEASLGNPVDMIAAATAEQYRQAIQVVANDPNIDSIIAIFLPPLVTRPQDVARAIADASDEIEHSKPILGVVMLSGSLPDLTTADGRRVPGYRTPEPAAVALAQAVSYAEWRASPVETPEDLPGMDKDAAGLLLAEAVERGGGWLTADEVRQLLTLYGVPVVDQLVVTTAQEAARAAAEIDGEVALKVIAPGVIHKSDVGGVELHLKGAGAVKRAARRMSATIFEATGQQVSGFVLQPMAPAGVELLVGVVNDPHFGPTVACSPGGTMVELLKDVSVRLTPLTRGDAERMLRDLRAFPVLEGYRGSQPCNIAALEDILLRISALAEDHPRIAEADCNPVIVTTDGAVVVDARVRVEDVSPRRPLGART